MNLSFSAAPASMCVAPGAAVLALLGLLLLDPAHGAANLIGCPSVVLGGQQLADQLDLAIGARRRQRTAAVMSSARSSPASGSSRRGDPLELDHLSRRAVSAFAAPSLM
jgi:hypothetical protein